MTRQITLTIPDAVYDQVEQMAKASHRPITDVLVDTIGQITPALYVDADRPTMLREKAAFMAMHLELLEKYEGQFVAISQGQVVDHDQDVLTLVRRIDLDYPEQAVLVKQVVDQPDQDLHFRSPRFIRA